MTAPRILIWDIETAPIDSYTWAINKTFLSHDNIIKDFTILTAACKLLGESTVFTETVKASKPSEDKRLVKALHHNLKSIDVLVHHNGDKFDLRKFNARAIYHGLPPLPPILTVDTLKVARKYFGFTSNRLDYLGKYLCGEGKIRTEYDMWKRVLAKSEQDLKAMRDYNVQDVKLLEKVYLRLRPFIQNHPNWALISGNPNCCQICGSDKLTFHKFKYTKLTVYKSYQCRNCTGWTVRRVTK